jgi:hypothetical protein
MTDHGATVTQTDITPEQAHALEIARGLIQRGIPVFVAKPSDKPDAVYGYVLPNRWQHTPPDPSVLDDWKPGDALGMVAGHTLDVIDVDPQNGGSAGDVPMPISYGTARTPNGGTHDLVAPLRVRKVQLPGVDVASGLPSGAGRMFVFIAPTVKLARDGVARAYVWETEPDFGAIDDLYVLGVEDLSGSALRSLLIRRADDDDQTITYDGPEFERLSPAQTDAAASWVASRTAWWQRTLTDVANWPDGHHDGRGGWEAYTRDLAWDLVRIAITPWTGLDRKAARALYADLLPEPMSSDPKCQGKWSPTLRKAVLADAVLRPPWDVPEFNDDWSDDTRALSSYDLFDRTPILQRIRQAAYARTASAPCLLVHVLVRVLAEIPASVKLPPTVGSEMALNLGALAVSRSGGGKSSVRKLSREVLWEGFEALDSSLIEKNIGSAEGLAETYLTRDKKTKVPELVDDPRRIVVIDEIATLDGLNNRSGSHVMAELRKFLTGESLGQENATTERTRDVPEGAYRGVVMGGVQPALSDVLLNDREVNAGTPQRFLWVNATDSDIPRELPEWPGAVQWSLPLPLPKYVDYPDDVKEEIRENRYLVQTGQIDDPLTGHLNLTRLKVGAALAFLHGETYISHNWWQMAGVLVHQSQQVQAECQRALMLEAVKSNTRAAEAAGHAEIVKRDTMDAESVRRDRVRERILSAVRDAGLEGVRNSDMVALLTTGDRSAYSGVLDLLVKRGEIRIGKVKTSRRPAVMLYPM